MKTILLLLCAALVGCVSSAALGEFSLGMTKSEVIKILGKPHDVAAQDDVEFLAYNLDVEAVGGKREYFVKLVNGKVQSYGKKGDFDSTVGTKQRIEIIKK